jgi:hypothetical protein
MMLFVTYKFFETVTSKPCSRYGKKKRLKGTLDMDFKLEGIKDGVGRNNCQRNNIRESVFTYL